MRAVARKRRDLVPPISRVKCSLYWTGASSDQTLVKKAMMSLIAQWRRSGQFIPVLRHARFSFCWARSPTLRELLSTAKCFTESVACHVPPACSCAQRLAIDPTWPTVCYEGHRHIAAAQGRVPWPERLKHLARWPASIALPPREADLISSLRKSLFVIGAACDRMACW